MFKDCYYEEKLRSDGYSEVVKFNRPAVYNAVCISQIFYITSLNFFSEESTEFVV